MKHDPGGAYPPVRCTGFSLPGRRVIDSSSGGGLKPGLRAINIQAVSSFLAVTFELDSKPEKSHAVDVFESIKCAAVIPCFNEAASVGTLVPAVGRYVASVLVVDDGSTDATRNLANAAGAAVVTHERNQGKGAALKTGFSWALKQGYEWAVTLDGDGQHAPGELPVFFARAQETGALLVIGNRMHEAKKMSWLRRQVNRLMSWQLSAIAGRPLPDTQCGLRLIHLPTWARMALKTRRFEAESEILLAFLAAGRRVEFVPIKVIPGNRGSHIQPLADTLRWIKWWVERAFQNFQRQPHAKIQEPTSRGEMLAR